MCTCAAPFHSHPRWCCKWLYPPTEGWPGCVDLGG